MVDPLSWLDLVLPSSCAGCQQPATRLCTPCRNSLVSVRARLVPPPPGLPLLAVAGEYRGVLRSAVLRHKSTPSAPLAAALVEALRRCWSALRSVLVALRPDLALAGGRVSGGDTLRPGPGPPVLMVPIPPSRRLSHRRPVAELLRQSGWSAEGVALAEALAPVGLRRPQKELSAAARRRNMTGALRCRRIPAALVGWPAIVVDDVVTTGASMQAAAVELGRGGLDVVGAVALGHTAVGAQE